MADLDRFLPPLEVVFPEGKTASKQGPVSVMVNGQEVKAINGSKETPEITQTILGLLQRLKDIEKAAPEARKGVVKIIADAIRADIPISAGVRDAILSEKTRDNPAYKDAFEDLSRDWDQAKFNFIARTWNQDTFLRITANWDDLERGREAFLSHRKGLSWSEIAKDAFLVEASPKAKGNWRDIARAAYLLSFRSTSAWDEIEVKVAK